MVPLKRPKIGVVADDVTGSGDIGVMFAKHGYAVRIFGAEVDLQALPARLAECRADVVVLDTDSRFNHKDAAYEKVRRATEALKRWGAELYFKKTCSVFRGNVGVEFDAMLDELGESFGVAVAAFPKNGRVTRGGRHFVHGKPLHESEFARDPVHPRTQPDLVVDLQRQSDRTVKLVPLETIRQGAEAIVRALEAARREGVGYALCDTETQEDLGAIARATASSRVLLGSSALAEELPACWTRPEPFAPLAGLDLGRTPGVLVIAGSVMPQSQAQLAALEAAGHTVLTLRSAAVLADPGPVVRELSEKAADLLARGQTVAVRSENSPDAVEATRALGARRGLEGIEVSRLISEQLARVAHSALGSSGARRLIVLGGDTSAAVTRRLGVVETVVLDEIAPGLPSSLAPGQRPLLLVLKSGSFGKPDFVLEAIGHLRRSSPDRA